MNFFGKVIMRKSQEKSNIDRLRSMAEDHGVGENALFLTTLDRYIVQQRIIDMIREELDKSDTTVSKEYVKGRENVYAHPLVKELPKHSDSANKTADLLLKIITSLGEVQAETGDGFESFVEGREDA
jgi:hypothetical protein